MTVEGTVACYPGSAAGAAFDRIAQDYDQIFTNSLIGRAQRDAVWKVLTRTFRTNDKILELNCGTGEDAIFLAGNGISVIALDASPRTSSSPSVRSGVFCAREPERSVDGE